LIFLCTLAAPLQILPSDPDDRHSRASSGEYDADDCATNKRIGPARPIEGEIRAEEKNIVGHLHAMVLARVSFRSVAKCQSVFVYAICLR